MTAIFDSCCSGTILDLPFIYDCDGQPKQQKICKNTIAIDLLKSGLDYEKVVTTVKNTVKNEVQAQEITAQTKSSKADVILFSGCKDILTSADINISGYGPTGAASYAFINAVRENHNLTYTELLSFMRDTLARKKYPQKIQMSTGFPTDMNIPFIF